MNPNPLQSAATVIQGLSKTLANLKSANDLLNRLEKAVPSSRAQRAPNVSVSNVSVTTQLLPDGSVILMRASAVTGSNGYQTRITFQPKQGFHCTCPDLQQRRTACKHIAALAVECRKRFWDVENRVEADVERFSIQITELEFEAEKLSSDSLKSLASAIKSLES